MEIDELRGLSAMVDRAKAPEDVFGDLGGDPLLALRTIYRRFAAVLHPDRHPDAYKALAERAFVKATALRAQAERKITAGTYGDGRPEEDDVVITTKRSGKVVVGPAFAHGDVADLRTCTLASGERAVFKIVSSPADNDLGENEANTLDALYPRRTKEEKFYRYLPRLHDTFLLRGDHGTERRVNVIQGFYEHVSLAQVMSAHPRGLDFRDAAWMTKRLLTALGFVHRQGFVHGAVLPDHVLVHPTNHGARLVDWCYARPIGAPLGAVVKAHRALYAPELLAKKPATPASDLFMAAQTALALMGPKAPKAIHRFWSTCLAPSPGRRPDDAWALHEELDALLRQLVGEPTYRPLAMPARA